MGKARPLVQHFLYVFALCQMIGRLHVVNVMSQQADIHDFEMSDVGLCIGEHKVQFHYLHGQGVVSLDNFAGIEIVFLFAK